MQTFFWIIGIAIVAALLGLLTMNVALWWAKRGSDGKGR
jgi:general stress protein CsbA